MAGSPRFSNLFFGCDLFAVALSDFTLRSFTTRRLIFLATAKISLSDFRSLRSLSPRGAKAPPVGAANGCRRRGRDARFTQEIIPLRGANALRLRRRGLCRAPAGGLQSREAIASIASE